MSRIAIKQAAAVVVGVIRRTIADPSSKKIGISVPPNEIAIGFRLSVMEFLLAPPLPSGEKASDRDPDVNDDEGEGGYERVVNGDEDIFGKTHKIFQIFISKIVF